MAEMTVHGGDVWQVAEDLSIDASDLLDFSANINPRGLPPGARERLMRDAGDLRLLSTYPDPAARRLRAALSEKLGVPSEAIAVGPGAEALLAPALRAAGARRVSRPAYLPSANIAAYASNRGLSSCRSNPPVAHS